MRTRGDPRAVPLPSEAGTPIGAIGALVNMVLQPHPLIVLGLNVWMGTVRTAREHPVTRLQVKGPCTRVFVFFIITLEPRVE